MTWSLQAVVLIAVGAAAYTRGRIVGHARAEAGPSCTDCPTPAAIIWHGTPYCSACGLEALRRDA